MNYKVKCFWCGEEFDRSKEKTVLAAKRRYGHYKCIPFYENKENFQIVTVEQKFEKPTKEKRTYKKIMTPEEADLYELNAYICQLLWYEEVTAKIAKQIEKYHKELGFTYSGMLKSLKYHYEINKNSTVQANGGIGIIPYVYDEAKNYYYSIALAHYYNQEINDVKSYEEKTYNIASPQNKKKTPKLFKLEEEN